MSITSIEVNTSRLRTDADNVSSLISSIETKLGNMKTSISELNSMWEGEAKEEFVRAFQSDQQMAESVVKELKAIHTYEENARSIYEQCEKTIAGIISDIAV